MSSRASLQNLPAETEGPGTAAGGIKLGVRVPLSAGLKVFCLEGRMGCPQLLQALKQKGKEL